MFLFTRKNEYVKISDSLKFQYNSCFCLSTGKSNKNIWSGEFQYNSCFCLSFRRKCFSEIFRNISIQLLFLFIQNVAPRRIFGLHISIQLLFLFIRRCKMMYHNLLYFNTTLVFIYLIATYFFTNKFKFQYNSCFYLSNVFKPFFSFHYISKPRYIQRFPAFFPTGRLFLKLIPKTLCSPDKISVSDLFLNLPGWENYTVIFGQNMALFLLRPVEFQGLSSLPVPASPRIVLLFQQKT